jgi:hypothetical protein
MPMPANRRDNEPRMPPVPTIATFHDYLMYEHPLVQRLCLTPAAAAKLRIGFNARTPILNGYVCFPLYADGKLVSWMGWNPDCDPPLVFPHKISERI